MADAGRGAADLEAWEALVQKELRGADPAELSHETPEGMKLKPLYTARDLDRLEFTDSAPAAITVIPHALLTVMSDHFTLR